MENTDLSNKEENVIEFLLGSSPFKGCWYGDDKPADENGNFWWRAYLRKYLSATETEIHNKAVQQCIDAITKCKNGNHYYRVSELEKLKR